MPYFQCCSFQNPQLKQSCLQSGDKKLIMNFYQAIPTFSALIYIRLSHKREELKKEMGKEMS